ncbi:MAG: mannose-1-phosphate guanylyltransferase/mannose-6-phosphate isomerase [Deltaproteobacteria bacterium]|nr:mannose-1-phosphate guanylyltransferase/mannose-6-phosphate isomerase [Deltaproteobacteria bacterium]
MLHAVILAGGGGTRLWPLSRAQFPKQFLSLFGDQTLLQQTVSRLETIVAPQCVWIVTGQEQRFLVEAQLAALPGMSTGAAHVLTEPCGRNTAAAIGLAAIHLHRGDPEAVMIVLPADHWIERRSAFVALLQEAAILAERDYLVTLGIVPDRPETGYAYIKRGPALAQQPGRTTAYQVERFVEKPSLPVAQEYVANGYDWNAGIFLWRAATILQAIATDMPALHASLMEIAQSLDKKNVDDTLTTIYQHLESVSIDYGVLEKAARLVVVPADIGWSDLGEWTTIHRLSPHDERGNTLTGNIVSLENDNSFVYSSRRPVAAIGLKNMVVVDTEDALLVCAQDRVQEVKTAVQRLQTQGAEVVTTPHTVQRPWGTYTVLEEGTHFKVKRIVVAPGASLSLQMHHQRSEHWVVVRGVAQVVNGEQELVLQANQSTYIPQETKHRLANPGTEPLEIIEVQTGPYLGEDDIVRFADIYGRTSPAVS